MPFGLLKQLQSLKKASVWSSLTARKRLIATPQVVLCQVVQPRSKMYEPPKSSFSLDFLERLSISHHLGLDSHPFQAREA